MKLLLIFFTLFVSLNIYSKNDFPVMLKVKSNFDLDTSILDVFRSGAEESLTAQGYILISKEQQEEALKEQAKQQKSDCYDDACLVDTGKMMAAQMVFITDINKTENEYLFKIRLLDLETGSVKRTITKIYKENLSEVAKLLVFSKKLTNEVLNIKYVPISLFKLEINSYPINASVYIDNNLVGKTPLITNVEKGKHKFKISLLNYNDITYNKNILKDDKKTVNLVLKSYKIGISSKQEGVKVYFDKKPLGELPIKFNVTIKDLSKKIILKKDGFYSLSHNILVTDFDKTLEVNLKELEKYNLTINTNPIDSEIYLYSSYLGEISLKSGESKSITKGLYSVKIKKRGYAVPDDFDNYINLEADKEINVDMIKDNVKFLKSYIISDVTIAPDLKYLSTGFGVEMINFTKANRIITLFGVNLYKNIADEYIYSDIYTNIKWEIISGFSLGLTASAILGSKVNTFTGAPLVEYEYKISSLLFIKVFLKAGITYFDESNAGDFDMFFMTSGLSIGLIGSGD